MSELSLTAGHPVLIGSMQGCYVLYELSLTAGHPVLAACKGATSFTLYDWERHCGSAQKRPYQQIILWDLHMTLCDFFCLVGCNPIDSAPWKW